MKGGVEISKGKYTWFENVPETLLEMDRLFRVKMKIPSNCKLVVTIFTPSADAIEINKPSQPLQNRIVLSSIRENPVLKVMGKPNTFYMKMNEAYNLMSPLNGVANLCFDNKKYYNLPPRKGFRINRVVKKLENRYILLFDYIKVSSKKDYTDDNAAAILEMNQ